MTLAGKSFASAAILMLLIFAPDADATLHDVSMNNSAFLPASLNASAGDTVRWTNSSGLYHTVTSSNGTFDSGFMAPGQVFTFIFTSTGTYNYFCSLHGGMVGVVNVANANFHEVTMSASAFIPASLSIAAGDTVRWSNTSALYHTVTADDGLFGSGFLAPGQTYMRVFSGAGSFGYYCELHPGMTGLISVGGGAAEPLPVSDLVVLRAGNSGDVRLNWSHVTTDINGQPLSNRRYVVYRNAESNFMPMPGDSIAGTTGNSFLDPGAVSAARNYYQVIVKTD